jgi:plastocyanin
MKLPTRRLSLPLLLLLGLLVSLAAISAGAASSAAGSSDQGADARRNAHRQVIVPDEDRFTPFAQTVHVNDIVTWINMDTDDHTVVGDDFESTAGPRRLNVLLKGTDNNGGKPGVFSLRLTNPGTFVYYCRFHSHLDSEHQPVAPGPKGGIEDPDGNHGTPMMGIITVLPNGESQ